MSGPSGLTGTRFLVGFMVRREWIRMAVWPAGITGMVLATSASTKGLYPTQADLDQAAAASAGNAAAIAFNGPVQSLDTLGGQVAFQAGTIGLVLVALMSLLLVVRWTRAEEESGRTELLRATVLGRDAPSAAALLLVVGLNLVLGLIVTAGLIAQRLPVAGSVAFGASFVAIGLVFSALALVTGQLSEHGRTASGLAGIVLGIGFVLRALGDIGDGRLSWLSPIGWSQKVRPFAGERWWPFAVPLAVAALLLVLARVLTARRDWGSGLIPARPGPARAGRGLGHPVGLALRLNRASLLAWTVSVLTLGAVFGSIGDDIGGFVGDNEQVEQVLTAAGGTDLTDAYFGTVMLLLALVACCFPVQTIQRIRAEETALHTELVLATPTARVRYLAAHLAVAWGGSALVLAAGGAGAGAAYAIGTGQLRQAAPLVGAALVYLPALWLVAAVAVVLHGVLPGALGTVWAGLACCFVVAFLGEMLKLPHWAGRLSPFDQLPQLPADRLTLTPVAAQLLAAVVLVGVGALAFRRRDLS